MRPFRCGASLLVAVLICVLSWIPGHGADEAYVIGAADALEIQVWDNKDLNQTVFVRPDGKISLPLIGEIQAGGRTVQQLQDHLLAKPTRERQGSQRHRHRQEIKSRPCIHRWLRQAGRRAAHEDLTLPGRFHRRRPTADGGR
jgi:hypothetical protein